MNKIKYIIIIAISILWMFSCDISISIQLNEFFVPSLFPWFAESDLDSFPEIIGTWVENSDTIEISESKDKSYILTEREEIITHKLQFVEFGHSWLFNYSETPCQDASILTLSLNVLGKIWLSSDTLYIAFSSPSFLIDKINSDEIHIDHVLMNGDIILTATTDKLHALALQFAEEEGAFEIPVEMIRIR